MTDGRQLRTGGTGGQARLCRLIDLTRLARVRPVPVVVTVGDVLSFAASGGMIAEGKAVEVLGILTESVLGVDGRIITPQGPPNVVLFRAREAGQATIDVILGDPWYSPTRLTVHVTVESADHQPMEM